jgi:CheY-like chemotaxis protein
MSLISKSARVLANHRYESAIDLLVTDVVMPKMGGRELAHRLSAVRPLIKVLYMSGYAENSAAEPAILDQNSVWLQKPFSLAAVSELWWGEALGSGFCCV